MKQCPLSGKFTSCPPLQVIVVHNVLPNIEEYVREQGIHLYWSYDL